MVVAVTGETIRIDWPVRWIRRLFGAPFLAAGSYLLWNVAMALRDDLLGLNRFSEDWGGLLVGLGLGLAIALPGLVLATFSYFVVVDKSLREIVVTRAFGPLQFQSRRRLADYHLISIVDDGDTSATMYDVSLCGDRGTLPIMLVSFSKREDANALAGELGRALKLPARDYVGTAPDDPDLNDPQN